MSSLNNLLSALTGISVMFVFLNAYVLIRSRQPSSLAYVVIGLGMLIYIPCNLALYQVGSPVEYLNILSIQMFGTALYHLGLLALYGQFMGFRLQPAFSIYLAGYGFFLTCRLINPMLMYTSFDGMYHYITLWGETIHMPQTSISLFGYAYVLFNFSVYMVSLWLSIQQARKGKKQHQKLVFASQGILILVFIHDVIIYSMPTHWFFLAETGFTMVIILMEIALANEAMRANTLAQQLNEINAQLEDRVQKRTAQLEAANRELEAFSYSISHDLRAPLRAINGFSRILSEDFSSELNPVAQGFLRKIVAAGNQMATLIDELLDFSRMGRKPLEKHPTSLMQFITTAKDSMAAETAHRQIEWIIPAELPTVQVDPILMQQVFNNLLGNAVKYTRKREKTRIEIGTLAEQGRTIYYIKDNGAGFDMQFSHKLFNVFQRLHREDEFEGIGIGLATVRRIIERHGGKVWAESQVEQGATFFFTLDETSQTI